MGAQNMSIYDHASEAISIVISTGLTLIGTYLITQKQWNRDDTRKIKEKILPELKQSFSTPMDKLNRNYVFGFGDNHNPVSYLSENWFLEWFGNMSPFVIENGVLAFTYKKDKNMNRHMGNILQSFNEYKNSAHRFKEHLTSLSIADVPDTFWDDVRQLLTATNSVNWFDEAENGNYLLYRLYVILLADEINNYCADSKEPYSGRNYALRKWQQQYFQDLQNIIQRYPDAVERQELIRKDISEMKFYLNAVQDEVNLLDHEW
jgi:hypothetical protein